MTTKVIASAFAVSGGTVWKVDSTDSKAYADVSNVWVAKSTNAVLPVAALKKEGSAEACFYQSAPANDKGIICASASSSSSIPGTTSAALPSRMTKDGVMDLSFDIYGQFWALTSTITGGDETIKVEKYVDGGLAGEWANVAIPAADPQISPNDPSSPIKITFDA